MEKITVKGVHGTVYEINGLDFTAQVKVTKPDGKVFYIPNLDIGQLYRTFELLQKATHVRQDLEAKGIVFWKD